jgi:hypothetical protein
MKYLLILFLFINVSFADTFKIQVFRASDNKQLYGLHANDANKDKRLADAMKFHNPPFTILVNDNITAEIEAKKTKAKNRMDLLKNENAVLKDRLQALIEYMRLDK